MASISTVVPLSVRKSKSINLKRIYKAPYVVCAEFSLCSVKYIDLYSLRVNIGRGMRALSSIPALCIQQYTILS